MKKILIIEDDSAIAEIEKDYLTLSGLDAAIITDGKKGLEEAQSGGYARNAQSAGNTEDGLVNINTADVSQLMTLPGIGQTRAEAIEAYRRQHGNFRTIEEIMKVDGIKEGIFQKIREQITVE